MAWIPCVRKAESGSPFCRKHGDAIFGAMLGALVHEEPVNEMVSLGEKRERPAASQSTAPPKV
jgi:hypothetical protein